MKQDSQLSSAALLNSRVSSDEITEQQDCFVKRASTPATQGNSDQFKTKDWAVSSEEDDYHSTDTQALILKELRRMNDMLDAVEDQVANSSTTNIHRKGHKLSSGVNKHFDCKKPVTSKQNHEVSSSSSDEEELPSLAILRSRSRSKWTGELGNGKAKLT